MFFTNPTHFIKSILTNYGGWETNRKIVVIESDDWGSIRMPSREIYEKALTCGYRVDLNEYEKYDTLLTGTDLNKLFEVLSSVKDSKGKPAILTANCVIANPDFKRIEDNKFRDYYSESIIETFKKYNDCLKSFELWKVGMDMDYIQFQFHAREHVNVSLFMNALQRNDKDVLWGFKHNMPGMIKNGGDKREPNYYVAATRFIDIQDMEQKMNIYFEGLNTFQDIFGFKSSTIIPTNYLWNTEYDPKLVSAGVKGIQGLKVLTNPLTPNIIKRRIFGARKYMKFVDLIRNNQLELSLVHNKKIEVNNCFNKIKYAFLMKKPAIISMHRINFAGGIFEENRIENLDYFHYLLTKIVKQWPDVEFVSSDKLVVDILKP
ncbi:hypothetical protein [Rhodonellum sp.]|uniref:hypothetical protein n=1 Tax=Rhodonellum sp. TaxID=2231180 RepID=UPI002724125D|nr:hypothetical protein [Rhodonellum sp.]MDO9551550.1 hypothetical protein [Rhodonellum sp.]